MANHFDLIIDAVSAPHDFNMYLNLLRREGVIEIIPLQQINEAYERTIKGDVRYRFVIDMKTL